MPDSSRTSQSDDQQQAEPVKERQATTDGFAETLARKNDAQPACLPRATSQHEMQLPGYEVVGELGRGAMGVVYKAKQTGLGRTVALKMIRAAGDAHPEEIARFKSEGAAIARLQHPNIVQIYEFGEHAGRPYFSLEFIDGGTLAQKIAGVQQSPREAAALIETLARAIDQAHQFNIVHRDLKPANVLLTRDGVPKITDFGLAKQTQADHAATATGMLLGTPLYMAPEQAAGNSSHVGAAADIYALGAILYELLAGRPPFQAASLADLLQAIVAHEPAAPRLFNREIPRDLETICLKCLQKIPAARYDSAAALADDLRRFLADQPIQARPVSSAERTWRWCRRNPWIAIPSAALITLLILVSVASLLAANSFRSISETATKSAAEATSSAAEAIKATKLADDRARETKFELARSRINEARMLRRSQRVGQQAEALAKLTEARDIFRDLAQQKFIVDAADWQTLRNEATAALLVPDIVTKSRWPRPPGDLPEVATDLVHDRYVVFATGAKHGEICRLGTGESLGSIPAPTGNSFHYGCFSAEGNHLAIHTANDAQLQFWDVTAAPRLIRSMPLPEHWRGLSTDGKLYVAGFGNLQTRVIRVTDGQVVAETNLGIPPFGFPFHPSRPWIAMQSGTKLLVFDYEQQRLLWERTLVETVTNAAWSQDGRWLAVSAGMTIQTFQSQTGEPLPPIGSLDREGIFPIPASRQGLMLSIDWSSSLRAFELNTSQPRLKSSIKFFSWPRAMGSEGSLTLGYEGNEFVLLQPRGSRVTEFGFSGTDYLVLSESGQLAVVGRKYQPAAIYHVPSGELIAHLPAVWGDIPLGFEQGDQALLMYGNVGLRRLPLNQASERKIAGQVARIQVGPDRPSLANGVHDAWGMDRAGRVIVVPDYDRGGVIYHVSADPHASVTLLHTEPQHDVRHSQVSPDGQWAVFGSHVNGKVAVYSTEDASLVQNLITGGGGSIFSPNGEWLAVGKFAGGGELFRAKDWKSQGELPGNWGAFSHDGKLLAVENGVSTIVLLETNGLREIARLEIQDQVRLTPRCFTPAGDGLVACTMEGRRLLYFDLAGLRADLQKLKLDWDFPALAPNTATAEPIPTVEIVTLAKATATHFQAVQALAAKQEWQSLASRLEKRCDDELRDYFVYYQLAILYVHLNDEAGYRRTIARYKQKFGKVTIPSVQEQLAKSLALGSHWIPLAEHLPEMLAAVRVDPPFAGIEGYCLTAAALLDMRQRDDAAALKRLELAQPYSQQDRRLQAQIRCLRALAHLRLEKRPEAEINYADALQVFAEHLAKWPTDPQHVGAWQDWLTAWILRKEAEVALFGSEQTDQQRAAFLLSQASKVAPPQLHTPAADAPLPSDGRRGTRVAFEWDFSWQAVEGAESYQFQLENSKHAEEHLRVRQLNLAGPRFVQLWSTPVPAGTDWRWQVRARVAGRWTAWSAERQLTVAPPPATTEPRTALESLTWTPAESKGLTLGDFTDGHYERIEWKGQPAIKTIGRFLYFCIDEKFAHDLKADDHDRYWLDVELFDGQAVRVDVQYDAQAITTDDDSIWTMTPREGRRLTGTEKWVTLAYDFPQPRFANRQNGNADFRLSAWAERTIVIRKATLYREKVRGHR